MAVALVHYPVRDRRGEIVTTSVTSVDIHDIARTSATYRVNPFFVVTPIQAQAALVGKITGHWLEGWAAERGHPRVEALSIVRVTPSLAAARDQFARDAGILPRIVVTGARLDRDLTAFGAAREAVRTGDWPATLLVFGTGWGLTRAVVDAADARLTPIRGVGAFNHLPVRAAVAIVLDRLLAPEL